MGKKRQGGRVHQNDSRHIQETLAHLKCEQKINSCRQKILRTIREQGNVSVQELADEFCTSPVTIRRDLMLLEKNGRLMRTHGGAVLSRPQVVEFSFLARGKVHSGDISFRRMNSSPRP